MSDLQVPGPDAPSEPLLKVGGLATAATAILVCAVAFGLRLRPDQIAAVLGVIAALAPLVTAAIGRAKVWSPAAVRKLATKRLEP